MAERKSTNETSTAKKEEDRPDLGAYDLRNSPSLIMQEYYDKLNSNKE